jgi:hypothetical protein
MVIEKFRITNSQTTNQRRLTKSGRCKVKPPNQQQQQAASISVADKHHVEDSSRGALAPHE